jgi:hypothetical protein
MTTRRPAGAGTYAGGLLTWHGAQEVTGPVLAVQARAAGGRVALGCLPPGHERED